MKHKVTFFLLFAFCCFFSVRAAFAAYQPYGEISLEKAKELISNLDNPGEIVGIYDMIKGSYHGKFIVLPNTESIRPSADYAAFVIQSTNKKEKSGYIKFFLDFTDSEKAFEVEYYDYLDFGTGRFLRKGLYSPGQILVYVIDLARYPPNTFIKTYP